MSTTAAARPIVVGFDGSDAADAAFEWAAHEAARREVPLHVLVARGMLYPVAAGYGLTTPWPEDFDSELVDRVPSEVHDQAVDGVVTPSGIVDLRH